MKNLGKIKGILTSELVIIGLAGLAGAVVFFKGLPFIGGVALGVAGTKMWGVLRK